MQDALVEALGPRPGERWLDAATGTGEVALRVARAGADVTGVDIAPALLEQARTKAAAEGLEIAFDLGDAQALPYEDASFDVVASNVGVIFAPDQPAVARQLARVVRQGGRLGLTAWKPQPQLRKLYACYALTLPEGAEAFDWGREGHAESLLSADFELEIRPGTWVLEAADGAELWDHWRNGAPPFKASVDRLEPDVQDAFRNEMIEWYEGFREGDVVRVRRDYLLILGRRR